MRPENRLKSVGENVVDLTAARSRRQAKLPAPLLPLAPSSKEGQLLEGVFTSYESLTPDQREWLGQAYLCMDDAISLEEEFREREKQNGTPEVTINILAAAANLIQLEQLEQEGVKGLDETDTEYFRAELLDVGQRQKQFGENLNEWQITQAANLAKGTVDRSQ